MPPSWLLWLLAAANIPSLMWGFGNLRSACSFVLGWDWDWGVMMSVSIALLYLLLLGSTWVEVLRWTGGWWFGWRAQGWPEVIAWIVVTPILFVLSVLFRLVEGLSHSSWKY